MANTFKSATGNDQDWDEVSKAVELPELENSNVAANIFEEVCQVAIRYKIISLNIIILTIHSIIIDEKQARQEQSISNHM